MHRDRPSIPEPFPGLVVGYAYLRANERTRGLEEGQKDRPAAIVATVHVTDMITEVVVLPITHTPQADGDGIEVPAAVKKRLGLDEQRSWIVTTEANVFAWPGYDLRPISPTPSGPFAFGVLPVELFEAARGQFLRNRRARLVGRD